MSLYAFSLRCCNEENWQLKHLHVKKCMKSHECLPQVEKMLINYMGVSKGLEAFVQTHRKLVLSFTEILFIPVAVCQEIGFNCNSQIESTSWLEQCQVSTVMDLEDILS